MTPYRIARAAAGAAIAIILIAALYGGLERLGWRLPPVEAGTNSVHGALMIPGFFGAVIGVERAVALTTGARSRRARLAFAGPALCALGALLLVLDPGGAAGRLALTGGSFALVCVYAVVIWRQPTLFTVTMGAGAYALLIGNALWSNGKPIYAIVHWWIAYLVLTIVGERLELARMVRPTPGRTATFAGAALLYLGGVVATALTPDTGTRLAGAGMLALAAWLARYDIARRTVRQRGLTRFIAVCLLAGYAWLAIGGGLALTLGFAGKAYGYDAILHSVLLGFVFSMIFGHAPIILPAVARLPVPYHPRFYAHFILLHASLILRVVGDLAGSPVARRWGGLGNEIAVVLFLLLTARAVLSSHHAPPARAELRHPSPITPSTGR